MKGHVGLLLTGLAHAHDRDKHTIEVARNITYRTPMPYRAVSVASLLAGMTLPSDSV